MAEEAGRLFPDDGEESANVIIHRVAENSRASWTHVEDLDSFFERMYRYYRKGGFYPHLVSDALRLLQFCFVVAFVTFLVHCVDYDAIFVRNHRPSQFGNLTFSDVVYKECGARISSRWRALLWVCAGIGAVRLVVASRRLYLAYDMKLFYNRALKIPDDDLGWLNWRSVQERAIEAQREIQMCIRKPNITELDVYHRILRFNNYMVAMANKRLLPLIVRIPFFGEYPYLSTGLEFNLRLLLFYNPWSPWESRWHLRDSYKDASQRFKLARKLKIQIMLLSGLNLVLSPLIQAWQVLYFFLGHAELARRSPESFGLRVWTPRARLLLRHFNELDHELSERLCRAYKPATKYLAGFPSPVLTLIAEHLAFVCGSILGVAIVLSVYDEAVLAIEHMLTLMTITGCALAAARSLIPDERSRRHGSEELLVRVLSHVHYLPPSWKGRAHTKAVAAHFQRLFQFRAVHLVAELLSPILCPFILFSMRLRALDIVDFYRNFTISLLDIGDVCSFAQMDIRTHGDPDWPAGERDGRDRTDAHERCEDGKTELSLVAFSYRNPGWRAKLPSQERFLQTLRDELPDASPIQQDNAASSDPEVDRADRDMSISALRLYDLHSMTASQHAAVNLHDERSPLLWSMRP